MEKGREREEKWCSSVVFGLMDQIPISQVTTSLVNGAQMEHQFHDPCVHIIYREGTYGPGFQIPKPQPHCTTLLGSRARGQTRTTNMSWVGDKHWKHWEWGSRQRWNLGEWVVCIIDDPWEGSLARHLSSFHLACLWAWWMAKTAKATPKSPVRATAATTKLKFIVNFAQTRNMQGVLTINILPNRYPWQTTRKIHRRISKQGKIHVPCNRMVASL